MKKIFYGKLLIKLIFVLTLVLLFSNGFFSFGASPDAIGFRVIPNPNHFSARRWYQENIKLKGSPQVLNVDGYEAVRDGRTVYVNAANIDIAGNGFYTNIYIISYNQLAENATVDIFGQILEHWKFNTNITDPDVKVEVIRDTKRLADLADIKTLLNEYQKTHNGDYPNLQAGSYLPGKSISVWPSWKATLSKDLAVTLPVDPVNALGVCRASCCKTGSCVSATDKESCGYNIDTCWNQTTKSFVNSDGNNATFDLPANSRAYIYSYNGSKTYNICALMGSGFLTTLDQGACSGSAVGYRGLCIPSNSSCTAANTCSGRTCNNGCAIISGIKQSGVCF